MKPDLPALFQKLMNNQCSPEEVDLVIKMLNDKMLETASGDLIQQELARKVQDRLMDDELRTRLDIRLQQILSQDEKQFRKERIRKSRYMIRYAAAACMVMAISAGLYFYLQKDPPSKEEATQSARNDLLPGGNKATLTLGDGSRITLNDATEGEIAQQAGALIAKAADGQLVYTIARTTSSVETSPPVYNTIETPKGGQYRLNLPDGTRVWLNAASSLRYPATFTGDERKVELTGEAYFEVAKNEAMPFRVVSRQQVVEVLGTHFNINSYADEESTRTTLLEGSVLVSAGSQEPGAQRQAIKNKKLLRPGQAARNKAGLLTVVEADIEMAVSWKNGFFQFEKADIQTVMRSVARWYDVEIEYEGEIPEKTFSGKLYRNVNASQVLEILRYFNVDFEIEKEKIIITSR